MTNTIVCAEITILLQTMTQLCPDYSRDDVTAWL